MSFLLFTIFCLDFVASAFFYFIAGEKCNFQVKFAFVHPPVCKNWLKLGKAKTSFFFRYTLGRQTSKFTHKYLLENMQKFSSLQFIWRYVYKSVKWIKMGSKLIRSHSESEHIIYTQIKFNTCFVLKFKQTSCNCLFLQFFLFHCYDSVRPCYFVNDMGHLFILHLLLIACGELRTKWHNTCGCCQKYIFQCENYYDYSTPLHIWSLITWRVSKFKMFWLKICLIPYASRNTSF